MTASLGSRSQADREPATWYVVLLAQPRQAIAGLVADISLGFIATGVVALLVSVGVAFIVARSVAKPLQRITIATEEIARGNYEEQLEITSPEEIGRLATSFNAMAREVEASRQAQSDFVANVSQRPQDPPHLHSRVLPGPSGWHSRRRGRPPSRSSSDTRGSRSHGAPGQ